MLQIIKFLTSNNNSGGPLVGLVASVCFVLFPLMDMGRSPARKYEEALLEQQQEALLYDAELVAGHLTWCDKELQAYNQAAGERAGKVWLQLVADSLPLKTVLLGAFFLAMDWLRRQVTAKEGRGDSAP